MKALFLYGRACLYFGDALADALVAGAMAAGGLLNAAFGVDQAGFAFGEEAGPLFQHGIQELIFRHRLDDFAFAEDDAAPLAACQPDIGVARFAGTVDDAAHHRYM